MEHHAKFHTERWSQAQAWAIRGAFRATYVGEERFARFWEVLSRAAGPLQQAAEALPDDPVPWDRLQWHGIGMQSGRKELDRIWTELIARDPRLYIGHYSRAQALCLVSNRPRTCDTSRS
ncbi:hypothetical protein [Nonomuraea sp. NPDC048916]|uniref:hypothetical protein n=1 Tax=Nonomuraea sp. NPDC048916 TaxID=3154232 RepID=UPI0033C8CF06